MKEYFKSIMHNLIGKYYFVLSIVTAIIIYGIGLVIIDTNPTQIWAQWVSAIIFWLIFIFDMVMCILFTIKMFREKMELKDALWGYADCVIASLHALAALGMTIFILDRSVGKDTWFTGIDITKDMYSIYVGNFLLGTVNVFMTAGYVNMKPATSTVLGAIWGMLINIESIIFLTVILSVLIGEMKRRPLIRGEYKSPWSSEIKIPSQRHPRRRVNPTKKLTINKLK